MTVDTRNLIERSTRLEIDDLDFDQFRSHPLSAGVLRCLRYMHDVEFHTECYLRDLLVTRAHRDPEVTAFLSCWVYEEHWHGEALSRVLTAHGEIAGLRRVADLRRRLPRFDGFHPLLFGLASAISPDIVAVHMTWGAVNEWTTQAGYRQLSRRADHPLLSELLNRIMRQEGRHVSFYSAQARQRLAASRRARKVTRFALRRLWAPVGSGVMPKDEVAFVSSFLFDQEDGRSAARRIDVQIDRLPGLSGLGLVEGAVCHSQWRSEIEGANRELAA